MLECGYLPRQLSCGKPTVPRVVAQCHRASVPVLSIVLIALGALILIAARTPTALAGRVEACRQAVAGATPSRPPAGGARFGADLNDQGERGACHGDTSPSKA